MSVGHSSHYPTLSDPLPTGYTRSMILYHEVAKDSVEKILADGLKRTSRGDKGDQTDIIQTDAYLDDHRPDAVRKQGVSRDDNLYAFVGTDYSLIDITNGATVPLTDYPNDGSVLLRIAVDEVACHVSDLDRYDAVKAAIANHETATLAELADTYWTSLTPLRDFKIGDILRPEVMITTDIPPRQITLVQS